ncbi:MAG TPA: PxKF domain-containing protein [Gaiellaceae bacterium]|nr:PxKF domain-containing protein [Gaiellaceae bacterium]
MVGFAVPGTAWAHGGGTYTAPEVATAPTLDGTLADAAWANAPSYPVTFGTVSAEVRFVHTASDMYVGVTLQDASLGTDPELLVFFDNAHDGAKDVGDDVWTGDRNGLAQDFFYDSTDPATGSGPPGHFGDTTGSGGTDDTTVSAHSGGGTITYELRHPLCGTDMTHDVCLATGNTYGIDFEYQTATGFVAAPGPDVFDPSVTWADLTIAAADAAPPTVAITSPQPGFVAGAVDVSADANDDVGVAHVDFEYFDGTSTTEIGDDSTAPYSVPFDTTQVSNTAAAGSSKVYATAYDAAGNPSERAEIDVGVDNGVGTLHGALGNDFVFLIGFPANTDVSLTARDPGAEVSVPFSATTDGNGEASIGPAVHGRDLRPGTVLTAAYGTVEKTLTLEDIEITGADAETNTVTGTAPPDRSVRVVLILATGDRAQQDTTSDSDGAWSVSFDNSIAGLHILADTPDQDQDRSRNDFDLAVANSASIAISGGESATAGAASAPLTGDGAITVDAIRGAQSGGPSGAPLGGIPLGGIPLGGIPLGGIPLGGIPLGGIGFTAANLRQNGLGGVPLSTIPLKAPDSWQARLDADPTYKGTPVQSITLADVLGTPIVDGVGLQDLDLAGSPLGGIPLGGIALGGLPLGGIPLGGIPLGGIPLGGIGANALAGWCDYVNRQPGFSCTDPSTLNDQTVIGLALEGVPLGGIPLGGIPLGGIPLGGIPLGGIPVGTPLGGIPLGGIDLSGTPLGGIPLGGIDLGASPLGGIPLGGIPAPGDILTCGAGCGGTTLADAKAFLKHDAKVQDLGYYCTAGSPADASCRSGDTPILLKDFVKGLPPTVTLADLLGSLLSKPAYDWESLPLPGFPIQDFSPDGGQITYTATFSVSGTGSGDVPASVTVRLPDGARYVPGSSQLNGTPLTTEPTYSDGELTWKLTTPVTPGAARTLTFRAKPGLALGTQTATAEIAAATLPPVEAPSPAATSVTQPFAGNGTAAAAAGIAPDTLYLGYTPSGSDRDYFELPLPAAGTQVTVHLSHLHVDDDLVVFGPTVAPLRRPKPAVGSTVAPNVTPDLQQRTQAIQPEVLADVPQAAPPGQSVIGVSDNRGLADEDVTFIVPEHAPGAVATIQVTSFDGGYSNDPWMLRVEESPGLPLPTTCTPSPTTGTGATKPLPASVGGSTLYLFNSKRFGDLYGATAENDVWNKLSSLASRSDAAGGTVVPVDAIPAVAAKLDAWYGAACSPGASNDVVRAIGSYLDTLPSTYDYVVVVGGYDVLPPGLVLDDTSYVNEREYASTFLSGTDNQYLSSYALGYLPTDDPYGDTSYSGTGAYVPEAAVGRLVETPAQIVAQVDEYDARNGAVDPTTALVTGYDFLSDGAARISANLKPHVPAPAELISETWDKAALLAKLFPASGPAPAIDSLNAHYDHHRMLPADQNSADTQTNLFTTDDLAGHDVSGRIVITMGCHSGVSVSDALLGATLGTDWAQTYAAGGAIAYVGNTGFGLGETAGVAYSEELHALLAERLDGSMTVGQALVYAKQEYAGSVPTTSGYHLKVIDEAGLFGLPMYSVGTGTAPAPPAPRPLVTDAATGLDATTFDVQPTFAQQSGPTGSYFTVAGDAAYENRRPIEPLAKLDVTEPGLVAHGALITGLVSHDQAGFDAVFSRAIDDSSALAPELVGNLTYPSKLQAITSFATPNGQRQRLLLYGGQFRGDTVPDPSGVGTQRLFDRLSGIVLYAPSSATDFSPPTFGPVAASSAAAGTIGFAVDIADDGGAAAVRRVVALYQDSSGSWRSVDLSRAAGTSRWSGAGPFSGTKAEWFIEAADAAGNIGVTSNKAAVASTAEPAPTGGIAATPGAQPGPAGWYTSDVPVSLGGAPDISYSLDGAPFAAGTSVTVSGSGVHRLEFQGGDGSYGSITIPIDVTPPTISIAGGILPAGTAPQIVCADAGSGVASCQTTPSPLGTSAGAHSLHVKAVDRVGNVTDKDASYTNDSFSGFFAPVSNPSSVNVVKAGGAVPVKFSLGLDVGLSILAPGYPAAQRVACDSAAPQDPLEQTVSAGSSSLSYDAGSNRYTYVWKTSKAWSGSCVQLVLRLVDGTEHRANFRFR